MKTDLFDYALPQELIAFHPPDRRDGGRLLVLDPKEDQFGHQMVTDLPDLIPRGTLLVANDTRVIWARLRGRRPTGGAVEVLLVRAVEARQESCRWWALARANKPIRVGDQIDFFGIHAQVTRRGDQGEVELEIEAVESRLRALMESHGEVPLPPYIKRPNVSEDRERYQTVFARSDGSVAAPTAGLHFTNALLEKLVESGVETAYLTLHVGPGTFRPVNTENIDDHRMDWEQYSLSENLVAAVDKAKRQGRPIIAVGTTVTRALEGSFAARGKLESGNGFTDLFIKPGFSFRVIDGLLTNFHLPRSTLVCLVSALTGRERILAAYGEAVERRYRFYSYGDAMLILPKR